MYLVGLPTAKYVCTEYTYLVPSRTASLNSNSMTRLFRSRDISACNESQERDIAGARESCATSTYLSMLAWS